MKKSLMVALPFLLLGACQSVGGPGVSSYFDCRNSKMLKVTYVKNGALVEVDNGRPIMLKSVPGIGGASYENRGGYRLRVMGDTATWNGPTREAPYTCSSVAVPR